jgi:hypothetical protein
MRPTAEVMVSDSQKTNEKYLEVSSLIISKYRKNSVL